MTDRNPRTNQGEFNDLFPGGIPDGVSKFINNSDIPKDEMSHIFSFLPKFKKKEYKVLLVGDRGVGKGAYANSLKALFDYDTFIPSTSSSVNVDDVVALKMNTNYGAITFNLHNIVPRESDSFRIEEHFVGADCAILMFDVTSRTTYSHIPHWYRDVTRVCGGDIPMVLCGNKVEIKDRKVKRKQITFHIKKNLQYYDISATSNYNKKKPFKVFAKSLVGENDLYEL